MTSSMDSTTPAPGGSDVPPPSQAPSAPKASKTSSSRAGFFFVAVAGLLFTLSALVPWNAPMPPDELDSSWIRALHWAHLHHVDFGHDFIFTFGPWGFALQGDEPATFKFVIGVWSAFAVAFFAGALQLARRFSSTPGKAAVGLAIFIAVAGIGIEQIQDARLYALGWMLLILHFYVDDRPWAPVKLLLTVCLALACQIKFSMSFMALVVVGVIAIEQLSRRKLPTYLIVAVAAYLVWWIAAGQSLGSLPLYLQHSMLIVSGYGQGEGFTSGDDAGSTRITLFIIGAALILTMAAWVYPWGDHFGRRGAGKVIDEAASRGAVVALPVGKSLLGIAGVFGVLLLTFKTGFVRHDEHEMIATTSLLLLSLALGAALWPRIGKGPGGVTIIVTCLFSIYTLSVSIDRYAHAGLFVQMFRTVGDIPSHIQVARQWATGDPALNDRYQAEMQAIGDFPVPPVQGTVDTYSSGQEYVIANGADYDPRPVIQSYLAYSADLSQLNADFLAGPSAPQTLLMRVRPIDSHYPAQEDALSWPQMLSRYDVKDASAGWLMLQKSAQPRPFTLEPLQHAAATLGQPIAVPDSDDPIWITIHVEPTGWGEAIGAVLRPEELALGIKTRDGTIRKFRLLADEARAGFLLSPFVPDQMSFAMLNSPDWKQSLGNQQVISVLVAALTPSGVSDSFDDQYSVVFSRLQMQHYDVSTIAGLKDFAHGNDLVRQLQVLDSDGSPAIFALSADKDVFLAPAKTQLLLHVPPNAQVMQLGYGMLDRSFSGTRKSAGVEFSLATLQQQTDSTQAQVNVVWKVTLDPASTPADRGPHLLTTRLPNPPPSELVLQTTPIAPSTVDFSYWSDVKFK
jgi:hypothetical protein